jgi:glutamine synthetase
VSLRVPAGSAPSRHVEHRFCGADANLYVAAAVVLAGALHGIDQQLDPGAPVEGNGYRAGGTRQWPGLPATWRESIERAGQSSFLKAALGEGFHKVLLAIKRQELDRWEAEVTPTDHLWYLRDA